MPEVARISMPLGLSPKKQASRYTYTLRACASDAMLTSRANVTITVTE